MDKKELINQYKIRVKIGGVYTVKNELKNKWYVDITPDLAAAENRFRFFGPAQIKAELDYKAQKGEGFSFEILEKLKKNDNQTDKEFVADLTMLKEIWLEKLSEQDLY